MPDDSSPTGSFTDLYEAMRQRQTPAPSGQSASEAEPKQAILEVNKHTSIEGKRHTSTEVKKKARPTTVVPPQPQESTPLVEDLPRNKVGYYFTEAEIDLIDEIQHDLRKNYRIKTSKNDIVRIAIAYLSDNYLRKRDNSFLVEKVSGKSITFLVSK